MSGPVPVTAPVIDSVDLPGPRVNVADPFNVMPGRLSLPRLSQLSVIDPPLCRAMGPPVTMKLPLQPATLVLATVRESSWTPAPRSWLVLSAALGGFVPNTTTSPVIGARPRSQAPALDQLPPQGNPLAGLWALIVAANAGVGARPVQASVAAHTSQGAMAANSATSSPAIAASARRRCRPINDLTPPRACVLSS